MNFISSMLTDALHAADLPGDTVAAWLRGMADHAGLFSDDSPEGGLAMLMSALAGVAAAIAVAIALSLYFRSQYRSTRDIISDGLAAAAVIALLAFVAYDIRHAALAYLGINPTKPAVEFEIRLPKLAAAALMESQVEMYTERNQTLAKLQPEAASDEDGHSVLRGSVPLIYNTKRRIVILDLPGQGRCEFLLRLPANPGHSLEFGPWHLADRIASVAGDQLTPTALHDAYAIRYRVL